MKTIRWNIEHTLYALIFLLALGVRLARLGAFPLSNFEAGWALTALDLSVGRGREAQVAIGPNPGYWLGTGLLFSLLGDTEAVARLWPALAGAALVFLPLCFRRQLSQGAALIVALGLALDPGLVAISRTAGGGMPALVFGLFALGAMNLRKPFLAGLLGGLALLSGIDILTGALGLALAWGFAWLLGKVRVQPSGDEEETSTQVATTSLLRPSLYVMGGALLFLGTLFFWRPQGLGALASTLPAYLDGWTSPAGIPAGIPALRLPVALLVYQPLAVIFGVAGALRGWFGGEGRSRTSQLLSLWALAALALAMLYPARQVGDLIWVLVPLWALTAIELDHYLGQELTFPGWLISLGQAAFLCILVTFAWMNLLSLENLLSYNVAQQSLRNASILIVGALALGALTALLVTIGWSWEVARRGLIWATCIMCGIFMLAGLMGASQVRPGSVAELWNRAPAGGDDDLFQKTMQDLSDWSSGIADKLDVVVQADSPSLRWVLRDWDKARYSSELEVNETPSIIITTLGQETPSLEEIYRGQDFAWEVYPDWGGVLPPDLLRWLAFREAPVIRNQVILWARSDIFPGGSLVSQPEAPTIP
jgi:hypothetical protein